MFVLSFKYLRECSEKIGCVHINRMKVLLKHTNRLSDLIELKSHGVKQWRYLRRSGKFEGNIEEGEWRYLHQIQKIYP